MCGCEESFVCTRCAGTPEDWRYWHGEDPGEREREERAEAGREDFAGEAGITRPQR